MNLLDYTKKLSDKIKFYDSIAKNCFFSEHNPFTKPIDITIIWIDKE